MTRTRRQRHVRGSRKARAASLNESIRFARKVSKAHPSPKAVDPDRALAAAEVLGAVWLAEKHFELEHRLPEPPIAEQDAEGHVWITVKLHVPALDIDMWLDGTHPDHPNNATE